MLAGFFISIFPSFTITFIEVFPLYRFVLSFYFHYSLSGSLPNSPTRDSLLGLIFLLIYVRERNIYRREKLRDQLRKRATSCMEQRFNFLFGIYWKVRHRFYTVQRKFRFHFNVKQARRSQLMVDEGKVLLKTYSYGN